MRKFATLVAIAIAAGTLFGITGQAQAEATKQKVVYHINSDDPKLEKAAMRNIQNHINAVGAENLDIKVVLHGNGLALLLEPESLEHLPKFKNANATEEMAATIDGLRLQGVQFQVCANTVKGRNVDVQQDLYNVEEVDIVPSGVAQLAILQGQGYAYIKP